MTKIEYTPILEFPEFRDDVHRKYEIIRPVLLKAITEKERANQIGIHHNTISKYLKQFREEGLLGLVNHRHAPEHTSQMLPIEIKAELFSLYNANPAFSYREIARIVSEKYHRNIDHKSVKKVIHEGEAYIQYQKKTEMNTITLDLNTTENTLP